MASSAALPVPSPVPRSLAMTSVLKGDSGVTTQAGWLPRIEPRSVVPLRSHPPMKIGAELSDGSPPNLRYDSVHCQALRRPRAAVSQRQAPDSIKVVPDAEMRGRA